MKKNPRKNAMLFPGKMPDFEKGKEDKKDDKKKMNRFNFKR